MQQTPSVEAPVTVDPASAAQVEADDEPARADREWLEADGLGGYAMGTAQGIRRRRYHALLVTALAPPTRRVVLVGGLDVWLETSTGRVPLSSHRYPDLVSPDGAEHIASFGTDPWPRWTYRLPDGTRLAHDLVIVPGSPRVALTWRIMGPPRPLALIVRPLLAYRGHHELGHERALELAGERRGQRTTFRPALGLPSLAVLANGEFTPDPVWYRRFVYDEEQARGYDYLEDQASPGSWRFDLAAADAALVFAADGVGLEGADDAAALIGRLKVDEANRRAHAPTPLHRAVDTYLVRRGNERSIVAGYPWFTDWGRDTFIALRGLCLATGRHDEATRILFAWARAADDGMLPSHFGDDGNSTAFNAVDASLWFVVATGALLERTRLSHRERHALLAAVEGVLWAYGQGTRHGIRVDRDGLLACGEPGVQLTWMDAKVGDWVVTPRTGKPVEVQALWINALAVAARLWHRFEEPLARARASFERRFWYEAGGYLYDVVDTDHEWGRADATFRANQLFAVGGLPVAALHGPRARRVVELAEARLWTPAGPRSLAPGEPGYQARYEGGPRERDAAYHQGTVWPWLAGAFVEAWVRVHGDTAAARRDARARFFEPLLSTLDPDATGHLPEIADAEPPHRPRGCPYQAWSVGEALRLDLEVLAPPH
jgi:predicted glycogen debranching enzyme